MINIALVGCDTSHSVHFCRTLNDESDPMHIPGARVVAAVPGGFGNIQGSRDRALRNSEDIAVKYGIPLFDSIIELPACDAIFIEGTDGGGHLEQVKEAVAFRVPIFIDKPLALSAESAREIFQVCREHQIPMMTSSALRFDDYFQGALAECESEPIISADIYGPMTFVEGCPGFFWYGIHSAEMLFAAMGKGLKRVQMVYQEEEYILVGIWEDGRVGTIRGTRRPHFAFGGTLHTPKKPVSFYIPEDGGVPFYASLLSRVVKFVGTGASMIDEEETIDIIRFLEMTEAERTFRGLQV